MNRGFRFTMEKKKDENEIKQLKNTHIRTSELLYSFVEISNSLQQAFW